MLQFGHFIFKVVTGSEQFCAVMSTMTLTLLIQYIAVSHCGHWMAVKLTLQKQRTCQDERAVEFSFVRETGLIGGFNL